MDKLFDLVIKNARVVRPNKTVGRLPRHRDQGRKDHRSSRRRSAPSDAKEVFDAKNRLAFPGCVDAHMHIGIYAPLAQDAVSESKAAAMGGVTSSLNYLRTGHYYLNRGGSYRDVHARSAQAVAREISGSTTASTSRRSNPRHIDEMDYLVAEHGIPSFKIFMFYGGYGLHGRLVAAERVPDDRARRTLRHRAFRVHHARRAAPDGKVSRQGRAYQRQPALRAGRDPQRLHQDRRTRGQTHRAEGLQRRAPAAFGRARDLDRVLSGERDQLPEHQSAAPELAQGDRRGLDHAAGFPAYRLPPRGDGRATCCSTPIANAPCTPRSIRRSARARTSRRYGRPCSTARSTGSSAITPAVRPSRNGRRTTRQHLAREIGLRRHRISAVGRRQRGQQARHVVQPHGRAA